MVPRRVPWISPFLFLLLALLPAPSAGETGEREDRRFLFNVFNRRPATPVDREDRSCSCTCGERNDATRIVGGKPAGSNEFPWIVRLSYYNNFYCAGMLINDRYVLTAAHCVKGFMWFMIKVTFGEHDRCDKSFKPETRFVLRAITGDFSYRNFDNDIAILRLNDRVPMTETIRPICLPKNPDDTFVGVKAIVSGWGTLEEDGKATCILQEVEVPVMSNGECKKSKYNANIISDNMMCAGYPEGLRDSCQGDSGGPLIRETEDKRYQLIGVVSWGNGCARPGFPGIYTRVTRYIDWIRNNTAGGCWCEEPPRVSEGDADRTTTPTPLPAMDSTTKAQGGDSDTEAQIETTAKPADETTEKENNAQTSDQSTEKPNEQIVSGQTTKSPDNEQTKQLEENGNIKIFRFISHL